MNDENGEPDNFRELVLGIKRSQMWRNDLVTRENDFHIVSGPSGINNVYPARNT